MDPIQFIRNNVAAGRKKPMKKVPVKRRKAA